MKPSFESAASLGRQDSYAPDYGRDNGAMSDYSPSRSTYSSSPPRRSQYDQPPPSPPKRNKRYRDREYNERPRNSRRQPQESRSSFKNEFEYSAPRYHKARYTLNRNPEPQSSYSDSYKPEPKYERDDVPPPPPPSSSAPIHERRPIREGKTKRYNSRESDFHDSSSDGGYDGGESSEEKPSTPPTINYVYKAKLSHPKPAPKFSSDDVDSDLPSGPSKYQPKEGETFVEGYEWRGEPQPMPGSHSSMPGGHSSMVPSSDEREEEESLNLKQHHPRPKGQGLYSYSGPRSEPKSSREEGDDNDSPPSMSPPASSYREVLEDVGESSEEKEDNSDVIPDGYEEVKLGKAGDH